MSFKSCKINFKEYFFLSLFMYCGTNHGNGSPKYKLKCVSTALMGSDLQCSSGEVGYLLSAACLLLQSKVIKTQRVQKLLGPDHWSCSLPWWLIYIHFGKRNLMRN